MRDNSGNTEENQRKTPEDHGETMENHMNIQKYRIYGLMKLMIKDIFTINILLKENKNF